MSVAIRTEALTKRYGRSSPWPASTWPSTRARSSAWSGPTAPARRPRSRCSRTLLVPTAGDAEIAGIRSAANRTRSAACIGYMPDTFGVYDDMRVWEYLDFFAPLLRLVRRRAGAQMIGDLLELVDLADKRDAYVQDADARHAAAAVPGPRAGPRPAGAAARRAGLRSRPARPGRAARAAARAALAGQDDRDQQPHPARARGAVHLASRSSTAAGCWPAAGSRTSPIASASAACYRVRSLGDAEDAEAAARALSRPTGRCLGGARTSDGSLEFGLPGDDAGSGGARRAGPAPAIGRQLCTGGQRPRGALPPDHRRTATPVHRKEAAA